MISGDITCLKNEQKLDEVLVRILKLPLSSWNQGFLSNLGRHAVAL